MHQDETIQAYQLRKGGTPARLAILRAIAADSVNNYNGSTRLAPGDWRGARSWTLENYMSAYCYGLWRGADTWYSHGRFIAGYRWTANDERVYFPEIFTDEDDAATRADSHAGSHAEQFAESSREDSERFCAMQEAENHAEAVEEDVKNAIQARHASAFWREHCRDRIEELRQARADLAELTAAYEKG